MFKKIICAILIALMLVTVFVGCNNDQPDGGDTEGGENEGGENNGGEGGGTNDDGNGGEDAGDPIDPENPQDLEFQLREDDTYAVGVGIGKATTLTKIEIPSTYKGKPVTELIKFGTATAFGTSNPNLKEIVIPDSITAIRAGAFSGCNALNVVRINDLTKWCEIYFADAYANPLVFAKEFYVNDELATTLTIPDGTTTINEFAFYGCKTAVNVIISDSVETIGKNAFYSCANMVSIEMGAGITSIGDNVFTGCNALTTVNIKDLARWCSINFSTNTSNPASYANKLYVNGEILSSLVIPESVVFVNPRAFYNCKSLTSVTVSPNVQGIGENAFINCDKLVEVINLSILDISAGATTNGHVSCYAKLIHSDSSRIANIDGYLFFTHEGTNYLLTYIGDETELVLPESYNGKGYDIYSNAFYANKELKSVVIPDCVTVINNNAFYNCKNITSLTLGDNIVTIGDNAFAYCNALKSLSIPDSVPSLGTYAFVSGVVLERLDFGSGLTSVGAKAFANCNKQAELHITDFESWCKVSFADYDANPLYGTRKLYLDGELVTDVIIPESVIRIGANAFVNCSSIVKVVIHDGVTDVGDLAFYNCVNLVSVELGTSVESISDTAFDSCLRLAEVINHSSLEITKGAQTNGKIAANAIAVHDEESRIVIIDGYIFFVADDSVGLLGYSGTDTELVFPDTCNGKTYVVYSQAFFNCENIVSVVLGSGTTGVYTNAFAYCTSLKSITIPASVTYFGADAFLADEALVYVNIADIGAWCTSTFANAHGNPANWSKKLYLNGEILTSLIIPEDVTTISNYAFYNCNSITSVTVHENFASVGYNAFLYCYKLIEVINHSSLKLVAGSDKIGNCISYYAKEVHTGASKIDTVGDYIFYTYGGVNYLVYYKGEDTELVLPESYKGQSYVLIDYIFLYNNSITSVVISDGVSLVSMNAFRFCENLAHVELGSDVTTVKNGAFYGCNALVSMVVKNPNGWNVDKTDIPSSQLQDTLKAADLFKVTYSTFVWTRK